MAAIKVKATRRGYYGQQREVDDEFEITDKAHFSKAWMVEVAEEPAKAEKPEKGKKAE